MKIFRTSDFVMAAAWIAAFIFSLPLIEPQALSRMGAIACIALFGAVGIGRELAGPGIPAARSPVFWAVPLLWLLSLASVAWSPAPMVSFIGFSTFSLLALGFIVFATGRGIFRMLIVLAPLVYLALGALALGAILQYLCFPGMLVHGQVRYPFANPNNYAALLMLGLFPAVGLVLSASNRKVLIASAFAAMLLAAAIMIIGGRAAIVLTLAGLVLAGFACRGRLGRHSRAFALIVLAGAAGLALQYFHPDSAQRLAPAAVRAAELADPSQPTVQSRLALWRATESMIAAHPLLGTGYGTFYLFYPQYRLAGDTTSAGRMAHNDPLQLWAEMGILAPLLLAVLYGGAVLRILGVMRRRGPESGERAICFSLFLGCGLVGLNALVNFDLYAAPTLALLGPMLGLWFRYSGLVLPDRTVPVALPGAAPRNLGWALAVLPLLLMVFLAQGFLRSEHYADKAQAALAAGDFNTFQYEVSMARIASFDRNARPYLMEAYIPMGVLQADDAGLSPPAKAAMMDRADMLLSRAEARNSRLAAIYYDRAVMARYGMDATKGEGGGGSDNARIWLGQALAINPGHIPSRLMLADIEQRDGHKDRALDILEGGLDRAPAGYDPESLYRMTASLAKKAGRGALERKALEKLESWRNAAGRTATVDGDTAPLPIE